MRYLLLSVISLLLTSCTSDDLMKYYYPQNAAKEPCVYKVKMTLTGEDPMYQYWYTSINHENDLISHEIYDSDFNIQYEYTEWFKEEEAVMRVYSDYRSGDMIRGQILSDASYSSSKTDSYKSALKFDYGPVQQLISRARQFTDFTDIELMGATVKAARFKDDYTFTITGNQEQEIEFQQITYYVRGMGNVMRTRAYETGETEEVVVVEVLTKTQYDALLKANGRK